MTAAPKSTAQISEILQLYQRVQHMDDPPEELVSLVEEAQSLIKNRSAIDLAFLTASDKQRELAANFWDRTYRIIAWIGANRSGKSWGAGRLCMARWIRDRGYGGAKLWCISQTFKKSVEGPQEMLWDCMPHDRFSKPWNDEYGFGDRCVVRYKNHPPRDGYTTIRFYNEEQNLNVFETVAVDGIWWDEASKESIYGRLGMRIGDLKGWILISTLPQEIWLQMRVDQSNDPDTKLVIFTTYDNEVNLPDGEIEKMKGRLSPEEVRMRIYGEWIAHTGLIFPEFKSMLRPEGHVLENPIQLPHDWPVWIYLDPGIHTCALLLTMNSDGQKIVWDEVYTKGLRVKPNSDLVIAMLGRYGRKVIGVADWAMDPQGWARTPSNELTLADEYDDCGLPFRRWQRTRDFGGGEQAMISKTRAAFADGELFVVERCTNTIRELRTWRWQMDDQQRLDIREKPMLTDNHSCDCIKAWIADEPAFATHYVGVIDTAEDLPPQEQEEIDGDGWQDGMV